MGLEVFIAPLIGVAIIFALIKLIKLPFWLLKNSIIGAIMLYICNFIGIFTIKITFIHCLIAGIFGIPGIILLIIFV
jgi:inhibitor of the pro-sigma K processing machinery